MKEKLRVVSSKFRTRASPHTSLAERGSKPGRDSNFFFSFQRRLSRLKLLVSYLRLSIIDSKAFLVQIVSILDLHESK